ncbi:argininosuccinate lyase [bacterium]|nr:argininosuccinate lyase [bacterium]
MMEKTPKTQVWGSRLITTPDELNVEFCAGRDVIVLPMADEVLIPYDIWTNLAHTKMLGKCGILTQKETSELKKELIELHRLHQQGRFTLDPKKEDVHINVEHFITHTKSIDAGKKMHTGRSRNDQVATDMRLFMRDQIISLINSLSKLVETILKKAEYEKGTIMPGFTHYQPAMLTTTGHWLTAWSQALLRDIARLTSDLQRINLSPLGAAASFGTSWPIDREYTAALMGFDGVEENTLDCISARGEFEANIASSIALMMNHLSTISQDIILLSTPYYNMLSIDDRYVTGSSIMPQKRNPDFAEIIRSKASFSQGTLMSLLSILKGSMSGYNRDAQQTKYLIMDLFREIASAPDVLAGACSTMVFKRDEMLSQSKKGFMNSADVADWMAQKHNLAFRESYNVLSLAVKYSEESGQLTYEGLVKALTENEIEIEITKADVDYLNAPSAMIDQKNHIGGPSSESVSKMIANQQKKLSDYKILLLQITNKIDEAKNDCFEDI